MQTWHLSAPTSSERKFQHLMARLDRYILGRLVGTFGFFVLILTGIVWLVEALRYLDLILNRGQSAATFFEMALYMTPMVLRTVLPIAMLAAVITCLYRLIQDSELVVMQSAGLHRMMIARPIILFALALTIILYILSIELAPAGQRSVRSMVFELREDLASAVIQEGVFNSPADGLTVYVRDRKNSGELLGIMVHDQRKQDSPVTYMAEQGLMVRSNDAPAIIMINGTLQHYNRETRQLSTLSFDRHVFDLKPFLKTDMFVFYKPKQRPIKELIYARQYSKNERDYKRAVEELHDRLTSPLYILVFTLIACAFMLRQANGRHGMVRPILMTVATCVALQIGGFQALNAIKTNPGAASLIYLLLGGALVLSWYSMRRDQRFGPPPLIGEEPS
ncbi:MAG: LPS export ABC transporter permease LptF [Alphaproteobacteria bacterium]